MGGTSTDISLIVDGAPTLVMDRGVGGHRVALNSLDIVSIGAGGGSIARVDIGGALRVGPQSAGAVPGPACYGQGGTEATVTDAAVVMGLLDPKEYLGGEMTLDPDLAAKVVERSVAKPLGLGLEEAAYGIISVANANMIQAIRALVVERGHDVRGFALLAFGGAGPLYAPYMARELGMAEVVAPRNPGVFAAQGLLLTDIRHAAQAPFQRNIAKLQAEEIGLRLETLKAELAHELDADGVPAAERYFHFSADMRCVGQFHLLTIPLAQPDGGSWWDAAKLAKDFHAAHERSYGHADPSVPVEIVNLRVDGFGKIQRPPQPPEPAAVSGVPEAVGKRRVYFDRQGWSEAKIYRRDLLKPGQEIPGPAIVMQRDSTVVILPGQRGRVDKRAVIRIAIKSE
jgi:N-methylhydantoinase A